jgi:LPXTG-motif cell wall-anchored protein
VKRIIIASVIAMTVVAAGAAGSAGTAWGASGPSSAVITFDDQGQQAILQIPDPPCDTTMPNCVWKFFLNEPKLSVDVAIVYGSSGTLTIPYPPNFCGIIQADAYVGPTDQGPWQSKRGWQHPINTSSNDCEPPTPPSEPTPPVAPVEPAPPAVAPVVPPVPAPTPTEPQAAAVTPVVAAAVATPTTTTTEPAKPAAAVTSLPFTGANLEPFIVLGVLFVALGLGLLIRRRKPTV